MEQKLEYYLGTSEMHLNRNPDVLAWLLSLKQLS